MNLKEIELKLKLKELKKNYEEKKRALLLEDELKRYVQNFAPYLQQSSLTGVKVCETWFQTTYGNPGTYIEILIAGRRYSKTARHALNSRERTIYMDEDGFYVIETEKIIRKKETQYLEKRKAITLEARDLTILYNLFNELTLELEKESEKVE